MVAANASKDEKARRAKARRPEGIGLGQDNAREDLSHLRSQVSGEIYARNVF